MRALVATFFLTATLAMPALLWAADGPPGSSKKAQATETTTIDDPEATRAKADDHAARADVDDATRKTDDLAPLARASASDSVTIKGFAFSPSTITVNVGDRITWTNKDTAPHTATAKNGSFDTGNLDKGESGSATFDNPGTFAYICTIHPTMKGTVVVRGSSSGSGGSGGSDSGSGSSSSDSSAVDSTSSDSSDSGSSLASTGFDAALVALVGGLLLGGGALLRRRLTRS